MSAEAAKRKYELDALAADMSTKSVGQVVLDRFKQGVVRWRSAIAAAAREVPRPEEWPASADADPLAAVQARIAKAQEHLRFALDELGQAEADVGTLSDSRNTARLAFDDRARQLRKELEALQAGAGNIARQGIQLRERKAQLEALRDLLAQRTADLTTLVGKRGTVLDRLEELRDARFHARALVASNLNKVLAPRIRIAVSQAGQFDAFSSAIADALKGSGLRYGDLAPALAKKISPRELLEAAESDDVAFIADATGITLDRTARLLAHLREADLGALGTASVEDLVDFQLLDGADYKDISELSTGQRCTVVLPIVLRHTDRMLIVDQPEDHIDNAFIADTLILSVLARDPASQIIFTSHNANIPVLGGANHVVQLGSDGKRGFPLASASLETPAIVQAITSVMEGGLQAFEKRRSFYGRHKST
ncbi:hypothetical protein [Variovorax sp. E3]|uniref:hypothetical protein n=1 Tax=Variovorax sp. E3 TaxID=1914993 RepID=UPI0018DD7E35|nr:hypothetical protein [Variovorax sp. E3]